MPRTESCLMRLLLRLLAVLMVLALVVYIGMKWMVGAVNFPVGSVSIDDDRLQSRISLPDNFSFSVYADDVPNARELLLTGRGDLLVSNPNRNQIWLLLKDQNGDGKHDGKRLLLDHLNGPNGMDFYTEPTGKSWLYIAEEQAISRIQFDQQKSQTVGKLQRLVSDLPGGGNHWKKSLMVGPDDLLYVTVGSSCNVCIEEDQRRATMMRYQLDGSGEEIYATGLRNSEGFDWSPVTGALYATDNGRDLLGDDSPPCELNRIEQGGFYGWPFANGNRVPDPDYGAGHSRDIKKSSGPVHAFRAHNAPLGISFLRHVASPAYRGAALVALHGSWNRSEKDGYKVVSLHWQRDGRILEKDFMTGFLKDDQAIGRPAEIVEGIDGDIYISDDYAAAIYRVTYRPH